MPMFSPLALTQVLPFLPLAQGDIDYHVERRDEPGLIGRCLDEPGCRVMLVRDGMLAVPAGSARRADGRLRLASLPGEYLRAELARHPKVVPIYLGSYTAAVPGAAGMREEQAIALDISDLTRTTADEACAHDSVDGEFDDSADMPSMLEQARHRFDWMDLRVFAPRASARQVGQATTALSLSRWFDYQHHCSHCGYPVRSAMAGWAQRCTNPADNLRVLFPRVEPAVIATVVDRDDRLLVQHNAAWKNAALYSVSAGFVEAGESLEHAVRRETMEETGIPVGEVKYLGSQPWPYKASLMMAFKAQALDTDIHVDGVETQDARWVTRDEYLDALASGRIAAPGKATIARYMIEEWLGRQID